ncbi:gliding motility-associated C-terminal domain-containing protein [Taibaiella soli]|nr:gliding motility-associated C-terminal domain-containing protein [Taibaiella soli]
MKKILLLLLCFWCTLPVFAQKENNKWAFGSGGGLDFNNGAPVPFQNSMVANQGCASVASRTTGQLLFYTNGLKIWNRNNLLMPHGAGITNIPFVDFAAQSSMIVPVLDDSNKYYVFSLGGNGNAGTPCILTYCVVDMTLNNGLGDVVTAQMDIHLADNLEEKMTAIAGDNCDVWVLVYSRDFKFKAFQITRTGGVNPTPVVSQTGYQYSQAATQISFGIMKSSPDRHKIAMTTTFGNVAGYGPGAEVFQFDPVTGNVSNPVSLDGDEYFGACFSPDNTKLYLSVFVFGSGRYVVQYDVNTWTATVINSSQNVIDPHTGSGEDLQLGPDGKIYLARLLKDSLGIIHNPNAAGTACNYQRSGMAIMPNTVARGGLPNRVVYPLPPDTVLVTSDTFLCSNKQDTITLLAQSGYSSYWWNDQSTDTFKKVFDAGQYTLLNYNYCHSRKDSFTIRKINVDFSLGKDTVFCNDKPVTLQVSDVDKNASYLWQNGSTGGQLTTNQSGEYTVTVKAETCVQTDSIHLDFVSLPEQTLHDITECEGQMVTLDAQTVAGASVYWSTGATSTSLQTKAAGVYTVTVEKLGCTQMGTMTLAYDPFCDCTYNVPSAFSPNNDGKNDHFRMNTVAGCPVHGFALQVFDRWGQLVYAGTDDKTGWDGTIDGSPAPLGVYMYTIRFELGTRNKLIELKGDITLIR